MRKLIILACVLSCSIAQAECYIMGDSIAQGVAVNRKDCSSETQIGLNTKKAVQYWLNKGPIVKDKVIISLGVNDGNINTIDNLKMIRNNIRANQVIWILPPKQEKSMLVRNVATSYGDFVLNINSQLSKDNIHPTGKGYVNIAQHIKVFQYQAQAQIPNMNTSTMTASNTSTSNSKYKYSPDFIPN